VDIHELVKSEAELDSIARILLSEISKDNQSISRMNIYPLTKRFLSAEKNFMN